MKIILTPKISKADAVLVDVIIEEFFKSKIVADFFSFNEDKFKNNLDGKIHEDTLIFMLNLHLKENHRACFFNFSENFQKALLEICFNNL